MEANEVMPHKRHSQRGNILPSYCIHQTGAIHPAFAGEGREERKGHAQASSVKKKTLQGNGGGRGLRGGGSVGFITS